MLRMESWLWLLEATRLLDTEFGVQQAQLCFLWSRMLVVDEIKDFDRHVALSFVDFLEALARVAEIKTLPGYSDLEDAGWVLQHADNDEPACGNRVKLDHRLKTCDTMCGSAARYDIHWKHACASCKPMYVFHHNMSCSWFYCAAILVSHILIVVLQI